MILYILIALESAFIAGSYWSHIKFISLIFAGIYATLAIADSKTKDRNLSLLVLLLSVAVAFPRLTFKYEELTQERRSSVTVTEAAPPALYKPTLENCDTIPKWAVAEKRECIEGNRKENKKKADSENAIAAFKNKQAENKTSAVNSASLRLSDWGMFFAYLVFSVCLPGAIFLIIHSAPAPIPEPVQVHKTEEELFLESIRNEPREVQARILKEKGFHYLRICEITGLSQASYFRAVKNKHSQPENDKIIQLRRAV